MKIVINSCYGGFGLSKEGLKYYNNLMIENGKEVTENSYDISRQSSELIKTVEDLGKKANGTHADLEFLEVDHEFYEVTEYDGLEGVRVDVYAARKHLIEFVKNNHDIDAIIDEIDRVMVI